MKIIIFGILLRVLKYAVILAVVLLGALAVIWLANGSSLAEFFDWLPHGFPDNVIDYCKSLLYGYSL